MHTANYPTCKYGWSTLVELGTKKQVLWILLSASKLVDNIVLILLARPDHAAGEQGLVDAVRELLGLQAESTVLPEHSIL